MHGTWRWLGVAMIGLAGCSGLRWNYPFIIYPQSAAMFLPPIGPYGPVVATSYEPPPPPAPPSVREEPIPLPAPY